MKTTVNQEEINQMYICTMNILMNNHNAIYIIWYFTENHEIHIKYTIQTTKV